MTSEWLPTTLTPEQRKLVAQVSQSINWDIEAAMGFCVALLEDVNCHDEAKPVNDLLIRCLKKLEQGII